MSAWVEGDLQTETIMNEPASTGRLQRSSSRAPEVKGRWLAEAGVAAAGNITAAADFVALPVPGQTQRRLLALATSNEFGMQIKRFSRMPGGFAWAGGIPPQPVNLRDYVRPPLQEASAAAVFVRPLLVDTSPPLPDEYIKLELPRAGAYIYVHGEESSAYCVHVEGEAQ